MEWFREAFDHDYLTIYARRDEEEARHQVAFLLKRVALPAGARILDLGCGHGRHATELARKGFRVGCLDLSLPLLRMVRAQPKEPLWKVRADMRHIPVRRLFDAVVSFFTSFGYFDDGRDDLKVLREVAAVLRPGGVFFLDLPNPLHLRKTLVPYSEERRGNTTVRQWRWYDPEKRRVEKQIDIHTAGAVKRVRESVRCYTLEEIRTLLQKAGLHLERVWGDFDGRPYAETSPRILSLSRKRSEATP